MTAAATLDQQTTHATARHTILREAVCLTLWCRYPGNTRKVDISHVDLVEHDTRDEVEADKKQLTMTKKLVDNKLLNPPLALVRKAKQYLRSRAISTSRVFGERTYLIPLALVEEVDRELVQYAAQIRIEAVAVGAEWGAAIERQRVKLGPLFNANDYMSADAVARAYSLDWSYVSFEAPERLQTVDRALFRAAAAKHEARMNEAFTEVRLVLRETLRQTVGDLVRKLEPSSGSKRKTIRGTVLEDLTDFLATFSARNLTDDSELDALVAQLRAATSGVDAEALRDGDVLRERLLATAREATGRLDALVEETAGRALAFDGRV